MGCFEAQQQVFYYGIVSNKTQGNWCLLPGVTWCKWHSCRVALTPATLQPRRRQLSEEGSGSTKKDQRKRKGKYKEPNLVTSRKTHRPQRSGQRCVPPSLVGYSVHLPTRFSILFAFYPNKH